MCVTHYGEIPPPKSNQLSTDTETSFSCLDILQTASRIFIFPHKAHKFSFMQKQKGMRLNAKCIYG